MGLREAFNSLKGYFVGTEEVEEEVDEFDPGSGYESEENDDIDYSNLNYIRMETENNNQGGARRMKMDNNSQGLQIVLARPKDFSEVKSIGDDLKEQKTVLLNLELVKSDDANRILDFLSGVAYAKDADIKMMATKTFAIMPPSVGFEGVALMSDL